MPAFLPFSGNATLPIGNVLRLDAGVNAMA